MSMYRDALRAVASTDAVAEAIGIPFAEWANRCHEISLAAVRSGILGQGGPLVRVARGTCPGVIGQHSWIVLCPQDEDPVAPGPYRGDSVLVDLTLAPLIRQRGAGGAAMAGSMPDIQVAANLSTGHRPHGAGIIWEWGRPHVAEDEASVIQLTPEVPFSDEALEFLEQCTEDGPGLDRRGWSDLVHSPMTGWPSGEIVAAVTRTEGLKALVPIDILGMATNQNPGQLYW
jgi:hypothetical protein